MGDETRGTARAMWTLFEPVHAVTYFAPQAKAAYEAAGLRGYWRGYFAGRAAPFGPVGPGPVYSTFYFFHWSMVSRALPDVWSRAEPSAVLEARLDGARQALTPVLDELPDGAAATVAEAADLLRQAALAADVAGRTLAAANADLPWPDDDAAVLWQAATILREHRGDGHVAALLAAGLSNVETMVWRAALNGDPDVRSTTRGWPEDEWAAAAESLIARGLLTDGYTATAQAQEVHARVEETTDALAAGPWQQLGPDRTARLVELLTPVASAVADRYLPFPNPINLPHPGASHG